MSLLEYTWNGLMGRSKCPDCGKWTPIKEMKIWSDLCKKCYMNKRYGETRTSTLTHEKRSTQ